MENCGRALTGYKPVHVRTEYKRIDRGSRAGRSFRPDSADRSVKAIKLVVAEKWGLFFGGFPYRLLREEPDGKEDRVLVVFVSVNVTSILKF